MGSFNAACGVSRISIGGGPTVLIPLLKNCVSEDIFNCGAMIISNDGIKHTYCPFTLPIFGEYNSYGVIDNIVEDENTRAIEKYYKCDIDTFVQRVCRPWEEENKNLPQKPFGMFVHGEVYDYFTKNVMNEYGKPETSADSLYLNTYVLEFIGFIRGQTDENRQRYNVRYTHPKINDLVLWSDGTWNQVEYKNKNINAGIYHPADLEKFLKKHKLFIPTEIKKLGSVSRYSITFDENLATFNKNKIKFAALGEDTPEIRRLKELMSEIEFRDSIFKFTPYHSNIDTFESLYADYLNLPNFKKLFIDFKNFEHGMFLVNADYAPSWNGLQYGSPQATLKLAKLTVKIMESEIKELNS